jgi:hypothetical protein
MAGLGRRTFAPGEVLTASNVMNYLQDQAVMNFADDGARGSALGTAVAEGMVSYLNDTNEIQAYNGSSWVNIGSAGTASYRYVTTIYYTSSGSFAKADYTWLRAIRVKMVGGGGGGGGCAATASNSRSFSGQGGGGGYSEKFITNIAGLSSSETITVGAGGTGATAGNNAGGTGGTSSAFTISATGGTGGAGAAAIVSGVQVSAGGTGGTGSDGDINIKGGNADHRYSSTSHFAGALSGGSMLGLPSSSSSLTANVSGTANNYGGGAGGVNSDVSQSAKAGVAGAPGIIIVELYS